jgi:lysine-N-methylase
MAHPIRTLPVLQNWDCHATGACCKEYLIVLSPDEIQRINQQQWSAEELGGLAPMRQQGWLSRQTVLNSRPDGSCVFLKEDGKCRMHEKHGYESKPLPCRLFPFVLIPVGDHWRVGLRYACPSAASNKGRALPEHGPALRQFAEQLVEREKLSPQPNGDLLAPPEQDSGDRVSWPDTLRIVDKLLGILRAGPDTVERRLRKCLHLAANMRKAKLTEINGQRLGELLDIFEVAAESEVPRSPTELPPPGWIGRILFRQTVAICTRKDQGPKRGPDYQGRISLMRAAWRYAQGTGRVPRLHAWIPEGMFEDAETPRGPLPSAAEAILERYLMLKVGSVQFCGSHFFRMPFWEGFEAFALVFPMIHWVARIMAERKTGQWLNSEGDCTQAIERALSVVDDHIGFNRVLGSFRQRLSFHILARTEELPRLVAWYSR